jgi:RimJ/RimL family protein N-acetyltransferase/nitrite reductase/ring-hydroxylating ferredoxin subunit
VAPPVSPPNPPLTDGVVTLRPFRADDAPAIAAACQDPEIPRWIPLIPVPYGESDARSFVVSALQGWRDATAFEFAMADPDDRYVGSVGIHPGQNPRRWAIGYLVAPQARGRGLATRAVKLACRWAFGTFGIERLALWTLPGNVRSQRVAEKAGFRYEGLIRNWDAGRDGQPVDAVMFSLTRDDLVEADDEHGGARTLASVPRELRAVGTRAAPFVQVAALEELSPGEMRRVTLAGIDLLVAWTADGIAVTDDRCPHMSAPLSIGRLDGCVVACPLHEGRFDLSTGETVRMPTTGGLDADGAYHLPWSPTGAEPKPEPPSKKLEARRLTRVNRLRFYPTRIRAGRLEIQLPIVPD